jgi:hypothetical protein
MFSKPKYNFLFVAIHKTGSGAIHDSLLQSRIGIPVNKHRPHPDIEFKHPQHYTALENRKILGEEDFNNRFKFTFVRNPWGHLLSHYTVRCRNRVQGFTPDDVTSPDKFNEWAVNTLTNRVIEECPRRGGSCDHQRMVHWPCLDWITDEDGEIIVDFVGKHETLQEDFKKAMSLLEVRNPLPPMKRLIWKNVSNPGLDYYHYYSDETRILVRDHFVKDIEAFDYDF